MVGTDDKFFNTLASLCQISPFLPLIGQGLNYIQPIAVTDTAKAIVEVLEKEKINNNIYELGGPNTFAFKNFLISSSSNKLFNFSKSTSPTGPYILSRLFL